mmetsp:Transcript_26843/g.58980  ORF Transcript_26843/g.58980 Transcript_26843/m.58980 type:complete len:417 (-) Transcript_26843:55-1305(-)
MAHATESDNESMDRSSRYDLFREVSDDHTLHSMWTGWAVISGMCATASAIILLSIALSPEVRRGVFNIYLAGLIFPDFFYSLCCSISCTINAAAPLLGLGHVPWTCQIQSVYLIFGFTASPWMNALTGHELCRLLQANRWAQTYEPPTRKRALANVTCVYLWSFFIAFWTLIPGLPHRAHVVGGVVCVPTEYNTASTIFFWLVFTPAFNLIPLGYTVYITISIWCDGSIRRASSARSLAIFFVRILLIFFFFWAPTICFMYIVPMREPWLFWSGASWSHLQGLASAILCLTKPDVLEATKQMPAALWRLVSCQHREGQSWSISSASLQRLSRVWVVPTKAARVMPKVLEESSSPAPSHSHSAQTGATGDCFRASDSHHIGGNSTVAEMQLFHSSPPEKTSRTELEGHSSIRSSSFS